MLNRNRLNRPRLAFFRSHQRRKLAVFAVMAMIAGTFIAVQAPLAAQQPSAGNCDDGDVSIPLGTMIDSQGYWYDSDDEKVDTDTDGWSAFGAGHTCTVTYPASAPTDGTEVEVALRYVYPDLDYNRNGIADDPLPADSCWSNAELSGAAGTSTAARSLPDKGGTCPSGNVITDYDGFQSPGITFGQNDEYQLRQAGSQWGSSISVDIPFTRDGELNSYDLGSWINDDDGVPMVRPYRRVMVYMDITWWGGSESVLVLQIKDNENDAGPVGGSNSVSQVPQQSNASQQSNTPSQSSGHTWPPGSGCSEVGVFWTGTDVTLCFIENSLGDDSDPWFDKNWTSLTDCYTGSSFHCTTWDPWWSDEPPPVPQTPDERVEDPPSTGTPSSWAAGSGCTEPGVIWSGQAVTNCWAGDSINTGLGGHDDPWYDKNWTELTDCFYGTDPICEIYDQWWH